MPARRTVDPPVMEFLSGTEDAITGLSADYDPRNRVTIISVRVPLWLKAKVEARAADLGVDRSTLIRKTLTALVIEKEPEP